jgi:hypothetical protein
LATTFSGYAVCRRRGAGDLLARVARLAFAVFPRQPKLAFFVWREGQAELRMVHTGNFEALPV